MRIADVRRLINEFRWVHTFLGLIGNTSFFIGSIFFLYPASLERVGVWLFIAGSLGMMIGSAGEAVVRYERSELGI